jgi:hypothetical protein
VSEYAHSGLVGEHEAAAVTAMSRTASRESNRIAVS